VASCILEFTNRDPAKDGIHNHSTNTGWQLYEYDVVVAYRCHCIDSQHYDADNQQTDQKWKSWQLPDKAR